jgi:hypothetical protein
MRKPAGASMMLLALEVGPQTLEMLTSLGLNLE